MAHKVPNTGHKAWSTQVCSVSRSCLTMMVVVMVVLMMMIQNLFSAEWDQGLREIWGPLDKHLTCLSCWVRGHY